MAREVSLTAREMSRVVFLPIGCLETLSSFFMPKKTTLVPVLLAPVFATIVLVLLLAFALLILMRERPLKEMNE